MFWNASARADINPDGLHYPRLSDKDRALLSDIKAHPGRYYLVCALTSAAVSIGAVSVFQPNPQKIISPLTAAAFSLAFGTGSIKFNVQMRSLKKRESEIKDLGAKQAEKIFEPLNDHGYSVHELASVLKNTFALWDFMREEGLDQPYVVSFRERGVQKVTYISSSQFTYDFRDDSQIERFVNLLRLSQKLSDECPEKLSALGECGNLIKDPGFVQKLARYVSTGNTNGRSEKIKLIVDSEYLPCIEEEIYNLCRNALVTLAVISNNEYIREQYNQPHINHESLSRQLHGVICSSATVCNVLASRLEQEIGLDIIKQMQGSDSYSLSDDQVTAIAQWSEQNRWRDPLVEEIDRLSNPPAVFPAINPSREQAR